MKKEEEEEDNFSKPEQDCTGENETYGCRTHFRSVMNY